MKLFIQLLTDKKAKKFMSNMDLNMTANMQVVDENAISFKKFFEIILAAKRKEKIELDLADISDEVRGA